MIKVLMLKQKYKIRLNSRLLKLAVILLIVVVGTGIFGGFAWADQFDAKIRELQQRNAAHQLVSDRLAAQANNYQDAIDKLQAQINAIHQSIVTNQKQSNKLERQIKQKEAELEHEKYVLGLNIKTMYLEGQISTLEILAASRDLSDFVDKEQYRNAVQDKVKASVDKIESLKLQLQAQQQKLKALIQEQQKQKTELAANEAEQSELLAFTEDEKAQYDSKIKKNNATINELKRQQALENIRLFGGSGGVLGGGGYPWGHAKCLHTGSVSGWCPNYDWAVNGSIWNWQTGGYGYRNCTDWVSFRIRSSGRLVPGGLGNANQWDNRAPSYGYKVSSTPKEGAAAVSNSGYYGHVMYVEAVNSDGSIIVSDYNRAGTGKYDTNSISPSGLKFVYF